MRAVRLVAPLGGVLLAGALFATTRALGDVAGPGQLGPGFWPRLVLVGLALACAAKLVEEWRRPPGVTGGADSPAEVSWPRLAVAVALLLGYVALLPMLGFMLATASFIAAFMGHAGARSPLAVVASAAGFTVALLYVFVRVVYLPLPKGWGVCETITIGVYRALGIF